MSFQKYKYEFDIESSDDMGSVELYEMEMSYQLYELLNILNFWIL